VETCPTCDSPTGLSTLSCPACGQTLALEPGTVVDGRFEILAPLGAGGMGKVYKAFDRDLDQQVALKAVGLASHENAVARFKSEIRLARKVRHKNVGSVWHNGYQGDFAYFVMELVEGRTLRQIVREQGPLIGHEACALTLQAAEGLRAIHEAGVVHRDVKTSNLMLDSRGVVRLVDFGIARGDPSRRGADLTSEGGLTGRDQVVGSPEYMSPEQIRGGPIDARTDLYSLGIVLYELLTGRVPFRGTTAQRTMLMHIEQAPPLDGPASLLLPPELLPVLRRSLAKAPNDRYMTARELILDLRRALIILGGQETATSTYARAAGRPSRTWWRHPTVLSLSIGLGLVIAVVVLARGFRAVEPAVRDSPNVAASPSVPSPSETTAPPPLSTTSPGPATVAPQVSPKRRDLAPKIARDGSAASFPEPGVAATPPAAPISIPPPTAHTAEATPLPQWQPRVITAPSPSPALPTRGDLFASDDKEVVPPQCLECPTVYPGPLERSGLRGVVEVDILVDEEGRVAEAAARPVGHKDLRQEALRQVRRWKYRPATKRDVPGKMRLTVLVRFNPKGGG